jgi:hypothetical protein
MTGRSMCGQRLSALAVSPHQSYGVEPNMSEVTQTTIPCPFTYANGRCCSGVIWKAKGYGPKCPFEKG